MGDVVFGVEAGHLLTGKISSIVRNDSVGIPKLHTIFCQRNLTICYPLTPESDTASIHLVK